MAHPFVDETVIFVRSGRGGDGCLSFRREKYEPRGGPDGGDGGRGGHVVLQADENLGTLLDLGRNHHYRAQNGRPGSGKNCTGACGEDRIIRVPVGTLVRRAQDGELLADLARQGAQVVVARGGGGGRGNKSFATPTHRAPREVEAGGEPEELELALELKLMADVGLLGLPNAGKSTLLARISAARPRVASYPFTTLAPQLGVAEVDAERRLVVADVPGIIEGAHQGVGLGIEFLRHLERTRLLVHLVDPFECSQERLAEDYRIIRREIRNYTVDLSARPVITALSKADLVPAAEREGIARAFTGLTGETPLWISAATGDGVQALLERIWTLLAPPS